LKAFNASFAALSTMTSGNVSSAVVGGTTVDGVGREMGDELLGVTKVGVEVVG
jgi:hypothetical protein